MTLQQIYSQRNIANEHYRQIVFEWEDQIANELHIPIKNEHPIFSKDLNYINGAYYLHTLGKNTLCFQMVSEVTRLKYKWLKWILRNRAKNLKSLIPCIIDFWENETHIEIFNRIYDSNPIVLISSKEAYDFLQANHCQLNLAHWALSLPDKYRITPSTRFEKKYDFAFMGRTSIVLEEFLQRYMQTNPDITFVYRKIEKGNFNYYTNEHVYVGNANTREGYLDIMKGARYALYSTPGLESPNKPRNQVTPRFLEFVSCGCHILARYPKNSDTDYYELNRFCPSLDTYEAFEDRLNQIRQSEVDIPSYSHYLDKHYTSVRIYELIQILSKL